MKRTIIIALAILFSFASLAQSMPAKMFRDNPAHLATASSGNDHVFDTRAWKFEAGSPVRSTPLVNGSKIYFGTTGGDFFALDKKSGNIIWKRKIGSPVNSSAAVSNGQIFFSDNQQKLYCLNESNGQMIWSASLGTKLNYPWRFDYYYSSPVLHQGQLFIGSDDGCLYVFEQARGKLIWKYDAKAVIRATPSIYLNHVLFGDVEGRFHALDLNTGKEVWSFKTVGDTLKNEEWGFDRKAILSSATIQNDGVFFGCRGGFFYCLNAKDGSLRWRMNHNISWVISTPAIKDSIVVTGTSDGRFVQAINVETGREIWKFRTPQVVWSSPLIVNNMVYAADFDGQLYCLDLMSGKRVSLFWAEDKIMSSPVYNDQLVYVGSDDGNLYALKGRSRNAIGGDVLKRFVFYDAAAKNYFQSGCEVRIKDYLAGNGFKSIGPDTVEAVFSNDVKNTVVVFASNYFPATLIQAPGHSLLRKFLDEGGRVVVLGPNSLTYKLDEKSKQPIGFNVPFADTVLNIKYGPNDTRSFGGQFSSFATEEGKVLGLPDFWTSLLFLDAQQVDIILGKNENGLVSSFVKKYKNGGAFIQLLMHPRLPKNLDAIVKVSEARF